MITGDVNVFVTFCGISETVTERKLDARRCSAVVRAGSHVTLEYAASIVVPSG
jgi:hypothetical protein